ncbi:N-acetyl-gamma-glutamyl-phosphate reductase [Salirhabdus salicampi]|uniref:N-acetyl-gamma-glutamyl-phosphate reductase n=1 Tax=Salirhabdus salicampi TaxID=476102 RepID=UPI0020C3601C|nr:N-acetyl-gamma-glutamyl-phosphate reductase [Salirhabdus salicampi]
MKVGIIGANGYSGVELIRLLHQHPYVSIEVIVSNSNNGKNIAELYPHLMGILEQQLSDLKVEEIAEKVDLIFFATPSGVSKDYVSLFVEKGIACIDLSGDFRLRDAVKYKEWYKKSHTNPDYLTKAVYGLSEFFHNQIKEASIVANPGCYPTATLLGLLPALQEGVIDPSTIIIDGKTGVSGAGRTPSLTAHFSEVNENVKAYKLGAHQHIPEIEQTIGDVTGNDFPISFSAHLVPMTRGIMCTMYGNLRASTSEDQLIDLYNNYYEQEPFVRIRPKGSWPSTKEVYATNYCDIGFMVDERTKRVTIVAVIDNVVKGAAGQAIQNMNLLNGWDVETGLKQTTVYP